SLLQAEFPISLKYSPPVGGAARTSATRCGPLTARQRSSAASSSLKSSSFPSGSGLATGWRMSLRLPRAHYIRLDSNDYSVHPAVIGRRVEVVADLDQVQAFCDGQTVADHERIWAVHQSIT